MTPLQELAVKGICFCVAVFIFICANLMVVYCINRERDKDSYWWMGISLVSGVLAAHLAQYL